MVTSSSANILTKYEHNSQIQSILPEIIESPKTGSIPSRKRKLHDSEGTSSKDVMDAALQRLTGPKDSKKRDKFDVFGEMVAFDMREMPVQQYNIAKKIFCDVLFIASEGQLNKDMKLCTLPNTFPYE